jgi:hypothetical protein
VSPTSIVTPNIAALFTYIAWKINRKSRLMQLKKHVRFVEHATNCKGSYQYVELAELVLDELSQTSGAGRIGDLQLVVLD